MLLLSSLLAGIDHVNSSGSSKDTTSVQDTQEAQTHLVPEKTQCSL